MANVKISQLPAATSVTANVDVSPLVSGGVTTKATPQQIVNAVLPSPGPIGSVSPSTGQFTQIVGVGLSGLVKATSGVFVSAVSGTDYAPATSGSSILSGNAAGGFSNVTVGAGLSFSAGTLSATTAGTVSSVGLSMPSGFSVAGSPVTNSGTIAVTTALSGILKGTGSGFTTATSGTDYAPATSGTNLLYGNGAGGFSSATVGTGLSFVAGVLSCTVSGTVTSVSGTGTVSGISLSGTVTTSGSLTLGGALDLSAPPVIGGTTPAAITGTTVTATTKFVGPYFDAAGSGGGALRTASGSACLQWGGGGGVNLSLDGPFNMNPANASISIQPTGTGTLTVNPATAGTINNIAIGGTTAAAGTFTALTATGTTTLATALSGLLKATAGVVSTATSGTDYAPATSGTSILYGNGSGGFSGVTIGSGLTFSAGTLAATGGGSMTYPGAGIAVSTGSAWTTSKTSPTGDILGTTDTQNVSNKTITSSTIDSTAIGGTTPAAGNFTTLSSTSNTTLGDASGDTLTINAGTTTFAGTGQRITGDFSSATNADRLAFQSSTTNGATSLSAFPNGTGNGSGFFLYGSSDTVNNAFGALRALAGSDVRIQSGIAGTGTYLPMTFYTGGSERVRIDTSGNVGIGTSSPGSKLTVQGTCRLTESGQLLVSGPVQSGNTYYGWEIYNVDATQNYIQSFNRFAGTYMTSVYNAGIHRFLISGAEAMRLDSSGNLGLGVTPQARLDVLYTDTSGPSTSGNMVSGAVFSYNAGGTALNIGSASGYCYFNSAYRNNAGVAAAYRWYQGATQAMTLDASGNLLVGTTSSYNFCVLSVLGFAGIAAQISSTNSSATYVGRDTSGNATFYVIGAGNIYSTSTSITAISDISLKENIRPLETGLSEVLALQPRRFDWKNGDATSVAGFIAQEVIDVLPDLVSDYKYNDKETKKAVKMGDMIPTMVKAIQELASEIEQLKSKLN